MHITVMNIISAVTKEKVGGVVASWSGLGSWLGTLCCVLGQDTLLSRCLSPPRCINFKRLIIFVHFISSLMLALVSTAKEVRAAGLRAFRHLFSDEKTLSKILDFRIDIFVVRCSLISIHLNLIDMLFSYTV